MARRRLPQLLLTAALALTAPSPATPATSGPARTVLTIYWSSENFTGTQALDAVILKAIRSGPVRIDYFTEYLESDRFPAEEAAVSLRDYIQHKYRGRTIDVVIAVTDVALQFALRYRADLFPDAPIVFSAVAAPDEAVRRAGPGLTGIRSGAGIGETLQLALALHPATRRIFYVAGASDPGLRESMRGGLHGVASNMELTEIAATSLTQLLAAVKAVPVGSLILYIRYSQDDAGNVLFPSEIAPALAQAARVPVYGIAEGYMGSGIVGGVMASRDVIGVRIGEKARRILDGARAQDLPVDGAPLVPTFDWRQLRRWGIAEAALPAGSSILFREIPVWQRYRGTILAVASVLLLQSALIAGLIVERRRRRQAEVESRRHLASLAHLDRRAAMGELATSLAHELNQPLNAILQNAGVAQILLERHPLPPDLGEMGDIISDIRKDDIRASEVIRRMRGLLLRHELQSQPVDLNEIALETIAIVRPDARSRNIQLELELADGMPAIRGDRVHLQQVLLNVVMNALDAVGAMPAERRTVRVRTLQHDGDVRLSVADTGPGIAADRIAEIFEPFYTTKGHGQGMGMGLAIARNIVELHAGRIAAENNAGGGATVWFSVPVSPQART
jgi:signal transduction histidine kinase